MVKRQLCLVRRFRIVTGAENSSGCHQRRDQQSRNSHPILLEVEIGISLFIWRHCILWWHQMVIGTTVLIKRDDEERVGRYRRIAGKGVEDVLHKSFTGIQAFGRVIIGELTHMPALWEESRLDITEVRKRVLGHIALETSDSVDSAPRQVVK